MGLFGLGKSKVSPQDSVSEMTNDRVKEPKHFNVIMLNDDFTTMEFVVNVLETIFNKDKASAEALMLKVHNNGRAAVGTYPYDIALTKIGKAMTMAKEKGFPFRMTVEEA